MLLQRIDNDVNSVGLCVSILMAYLGIRVRFAHWHVAARSSTAFLRIFPVAVIGISVAWT